jgi:hypothetical protein
LGGPASSGDANVLSPLRASAAAIPEEGGGNSGGGGGEGGGGGGEDSGGGGEDSGGREGGARDGSLCDLETAKQLFKSLAEPLPMARGAKVVVQRSDASWAHATVPQSFLVPAHPPWAPADPPHARAHTRRAKEQHLRNCLEIT